MDHPALSTRPQLQLSPPASAFSLHPRLFTPPPLHFTIFYPGALLWLFQPYPYYQHGGLIFKSYTCTFSQGNPSNLWHRSVQQLLGLHECLTGLIKLVVQRTLLNRENLYKGMLKSASFRVWIKNKDNVGNLYLMLCFAAPFKDDERLKNYDGKPSKTRPVDGFGTDVNNPTTANYLGPIGRNMPAVPKHLRDPKGSPDVQMVAQPLNSWILWLLLGFRPWFMIGSITWIVIKISLSARVQVCVL